MCTYTDTLEGFFIAAMIDNHCFYRQDHRTNKCTEVQNPRYRDVTLNAYTSPYEQKLSLESIII